MSSPSSDGPLAAMALKPGIMTVLSKVLHPSILDPLNFADWYENTHIQEVQRTGGISHTSRYESLPFTRQYRQRHEGLGLSNRGCPYDFFTLYHMPDLAFRDTRAFKSLNGQSRPSDESDLLGSLFEQAEFATRFCATLSGQHVGNECAASAPYLVTIAHSSTVKVLLPSTYRSKGRFEIIERSILSAFRRTYVRQPTELLVYGFETEDDVVAAARTLPDFEGSEIGFWALRRHYTGTETTPAVWRPQNRRPSSS